VRLFRFAHVAGTVVSLVALAAVISAADSPAALAGLRGQKDRVSAADFTLRDATGTTVRLSSFRGQVVLLDFWATWCTGCKVEIPWYMDFQKKYGHRGLRSIGVAMDEEGWQKVKLSEGSPNQLSRRDRVPGSDDAIPHHKSARHVAHRSLWKNR
jgi:thiol-disulfide isomerase/thioredoxin